MLALKVANALNTHTKLTVAEPRRAHVGCIAGSFVDLSCITARLPHYDLRSIQVGAREDVVTREEVSDGSAIPSEAVFASYAKLWLDLILRFDDGSGPTQNPILASAVACSLASRPQQAGELIDLTLSAEGTLNGNRPS